MSQNDIDDADDDDADDDDDDDNDVDDDDADDDDDDPPKNKKHTPPYFASAFAIVHWLSRRSRHGSAYICAPFKAGNAVNRKEDTYF